MMKKNILLVIAALALFSPAKIIAAASAPAAALTGRISSTEEARMEGVLVSAKRDGSTVTTTVVSGADGRYSFSGARLEPGRYAIAVRAAGYELDGAKTALVAAGKTAGLDLKLKKTAHPAPPLSNREWLMSIPGAHEQKEGLFNFVSCPTVERPT